MKPNFYTYMQYCIWSKPNQSRCFSMQEKSFITTIKSDDYILHSMRCWSINGVFLTCLWGPLNRFWEGPGSHWMGLLLLLLGTLIWIPQNRCRTTLPTWWGFLVVFGTGCIPTLPALEIIQIKKPEIDEALTALSTSTAEQTFCHVSGQKLSLPWTTKNIEILNNIIYSNIFL